MITAKDLQEAIAECQGQRNPNANTCIKLAAFLIIQREMFSNEEPTNPGGALPATYSYASAPGEQIEKTIDYYSDTDFSRAVDGKNIDDVLSVMDELMTTLQAVYPRLYAGVMRQLDK